MGVEIIHDTVESVDYSSDILQCFGESGVTYKGKSVNIATGAYSKWLGVRRNKIFGNRSIRVRYMRWFLL
ncbi:MAG: hypothetical protein ACRCZQ_05305 [Bacteroidales bacterium]